MFNSRNSINILKWKSKKVDLFLLFKYILIKTRAQIVNIVKLRNYKNTIKIYLKYIANKCVEWYTVNIFFDQRIVWMWKRFE